MKKNNDDKYLEWLKSNKAFLNISGIERELQLPDSTLKKFLHNKRDIPERWKEQIVTFIKQIKE